MKRAIFGCLLLATIAFIPFPACIAAESGETPQSLYLRAGKLERQGELNKAKDLYEALIERYPASEFAVKANDRLLELVKPARTTVETGAPAATPVQPLTAGDPIKRRAMEMARMYSKAIYLRDDEFNRHDYAFRTKYGHQYNRAELAQRQTEWRKAADRKVRQELGMGVDEIKKKLDEACMELGITEKDCNETTLK